MPALVQGEGHQGPSCRNLSTIEVGKDSGIEFQEWVGCEMEFQRWVGCDIEFGGQVGCGMEFHKYILPSF